MHSRNALLIGLLLAATAIHLGGCGPSHEQIMLAKAMSARVDRQPTYVDSAKFLQGYLAKHDKDYVMWAMDYASICMMSGNHDAAKSELLKCFMDIEKRQDTDKEKRAAASNEASKIFKGEPFERAMVCTYLGMLHYLTGDYNNARIFFTRADMADATTEENMKDYRHDFRLTHYWLGRTYLKLGDEGNARVAFRKAAQRITRKAEERELKSIRSRQTKARKKRMRLEAESYKRSTQGENAIPSVVDMSASPAFSEAPSTLLDEGDFPNPVVLCANGPEQFLSVDYQKQVNLILVVEVGTGPIKFLIGENQYMDRIIRSPYEERSVMVYLDGQKAGRAHQLLDMFHQADTRGTGEKDRVQMTKGVTQSILRRLPYIGYIAAYWDVRADHRYWHLLPGETYVFAAKVKPGSYTVTLQCFDANGYLLPRYRLTRYYIPVRAGEESIYFLHTKPEADNTYFAAE